MWIIVPLKYLQNSKFRLAELLSEEQRAELSVMMLRDVLDTLSGTDVVSGITIVSSERSLVSIASEYNAECLLTDSDEGYSEDAHKAILKVCETQTGSVAVIPADVPLLNEEDISELEARHQGGITLCPALNDGGTNALLFDAPLPIPLLFGPDSFRRYKDKAAELKLKVNIAKIAGLERDIDRPDDIAYLLRQSSNKKTVQYLKQLNLDCKLN